MVRNQPGRSKKEKMKLDTFESKNSTEAICDDI